MDKAMASELRPNQRRPMQYTDEEERIHAEKLELKEKLRRAFHENLHDPSATIDGLYDILKSSHKYYAPAPSHKRRYRDFFIGFLHMEDDLWNFRVSTQYFDVRVPPRLSDGTPVNFRNKLVLKSMARKAMMDSRKNDSLVVRLLVKYAEKTVRNIYYALDFKQDNYFAQSVVQGIDFEQSKIQLKMDKIIKYGLIENSLGTIRDHHFFGRNDLAKTYGRTLSLGKLIRDRFKSYGTCVGV